jgi:hypothetical protein
MEKIFFAGERAAEFYGDGDRAVGGNLPWAL